MFWSSVDLPMEYFDLRDVLVREEYVCVRFPHRITSLDFALGQERREIPAHKRFEVPVFLLDFILQNDHCSVDRDVVPVEIREDLRAKPSNVRLCDISRHFYGLARIFYSQDAEFFCDVFLNRISCFLQKFVEKKLDEQDLDIMDASEADIMRMAIKNTNLHSILGTRHRNVHQSL